MKEESIILQHFESLSKMKVMPREHIDYLQHIKESYKFSPNVIYDIGSCVLHWTQIAAEIWRDSKIYLFDGTEHLNLLYDKTNYEYNIDVLSDADDKEALFYQSFEGPHGNSYYKEHSHFTDIYYGSDSETTKITRTVDSIVQERKFLEPDLVKIDVQGAEVDILKGMTKTLDTVKHLIIEHQHSEYNINAPLASESVPFVESLGFKLVKELFANNGPDGDYHYIKVD